MSCLVFNLVNDVDVESTRRKVEAYRKANKELIAKNKFKKVCKILASNTFIISS